MANRLSRIGQSYIYLETYTPAKSATTDYWRSVGANALDDFRTTDI